jgi:hypothetical protein
MMRARRLTTTGLVTLGVLAGGLALASAPALAATHYSLTGSFGSEGSGNGELKEPSGVAVNAATKDVYVVDKGNRRIDEFESDGAFIRAWGWEVDGLPGFGTCTTITTCQAGSAGSGAGQLDAPEAIAVDNSGSASDPSKEDVYVTNTTDNVIEKFSATGAYEGQLTGTCAAAGESPPSCVGSAFIAFGGLLGVAVDPSGNVWVYESDSEGEGVVAEFSDTGSFDKTFETHRGTGRGLAVDSSDNVYLVPGSENVTKWDSTTGTEVTGEFSENVSALAIDPATNGPATNGLFVDRRSIVSEYGPFGEPFVEEFGSKGLADGGGSGIAVSATGATYVADSIGDRVDVFTEVPVASAAPEAPLTEAASGETAGSAVLHGELNPAVKAQAGWYFAYNLGSECTGGQSTLEEPEAEVLAAKESREVTGLEPNAQYTVCFVAENTFGPTFGAPIPFPTLAPPPTIETGSEKVSALTPFEATLEAKINPNNQKTKYTFEYSTSENGAGVLTGTIVKERGAAELEGYPEKLASVALTGLEAGKTYFYRVVAENAKGEKAIPGAVESFTTLSTGAPKVDGESTSAVTSTGAKLEAQVNPEYLETTYSFEYATNKALTDNEVTLPGQYPLKSGFGDQTASVATGVLAPGTTYYYRVVATNATPPATDGAVESFTTSPSAPLASTGAVSEIGQSSANVTGTVKPEGAETYYYYQYGPTTEYGQRTFAGYPGINVGAGTSPVAAPATLVPLTPGVTYHYRLVAWNAEGTTYGQDETFTAEAGLPPLASTGAASGVSVNEATISGTIDPQGKETSYRFEYGTDTEYGTQAFGTVLPEQGEQTVALSLRGLDPSTTYHYRLVVSSPAGTSEGADQTFTTPGILDPLVNPVTTPLIANPAIAFPTGSQENTGTTETKTLTNAEKLKKALKGCKKEKKSKRSTCEKQAHKKYGPKKKKQ